MSFSCSFVCHTQAHMHTHTCTHSQTRIQIVPLALCQSANKTNCSTVAVGTPGGWAGIGHLLATSRYTRTPTHTHSCTCVHLSIAVLLPFRSLSLAATSARRHWLLFWLLAPLAVPTQQAKPSSSTSSWAMLILNSLHIQWLLQFSNWLRRRPTDWDSLTLNDTRPTIRLLRFPRIYLIWNHSPPIIV